MYLSIFSLTCQTLSWLKDNVSTATRVCSTASSEGLEAARRCQHAVEQEILTNKARIEVVKRVSTGCHVSRARVSLKETPLTNWAS